MIEWKTFPSSVPYESFVTVMEHRAFEIYSGRKKEIVYLLEHDDVYTGGVGAKDDELVDKSTKIPIFRTGRGGKFTYHGKGMRIIYPLINLNPSVIGENIPRNSNRVPDIKLYIRNLEEITIKTIRAFGVKAYRIDGMVGIWVNSKKFNRPAKIAAIGIRLSKWVSYHGISVNINPDLTKYNAIIPCGIKEFSITSLFNEGTEITCSEFDKIFKFNFEKKFL